MNRVMSALLLAGMVGLAVSSAQGAVLITFDVRAMGGAKEVIAGPGEVVQLELWAIVANLNVTMADDGFKASQGSLVSTGTLLGTIRGDEPGTTATKTNNVSPFAESGAQSGFQYDLDMDGDLDVGSYDTGGPTILPWFIATSAPAETLGHAEILIGRFTFTVEGGLGETDIQYVPRNRTSGTNTQKQLHIFQSDGTEYKLVGSSTQIGTGEPLVIMPEPATIALLGLGGLVALLRRKR